MTTQLTKPAALRIESFLVCPPGLTLVPPLGSRPAQHDHIVRVQVAGELDVAIAPVVIDELRDVARGHSVRASWATQPAIELDLSELTFLDSGGLTALSDSRSILRETGCGLCLTFPRPGVLRMLEGAVHNGWLAPDVECGGYPWPPVTRPIRAGTVLPGPRSRTGQALRPFPAHFP